MAFGPLERRWHCWNGETSLCKGLSFNLSRKVLSDIGAPSPVVKRLRFQPLPIIVSMSQNLGTSPTLAMRLRKIFHSTALWTM